MYKISELTGKIYLNGVEIPLDDSTPQFQQYLEDKDIVGVECVESTEEEIAEANKPKVPIQVKNMKFRLALIKSGIMPSSIDSLITQMPEGAMKENIFTLWNFADYLERNDASLNYMAGQFNITHEQLDNLFILSDTL